MATPVDLLTSLTLKISRLRPSQVLGSGTSHDSVRLRGLLADKVGVRHTLTSSKAWRWSNQLIALGCYQFNRLYVVGVHGNSQVVAWSTATIGGVSLGKYYQPCRTFEGMQGENTVHYPSNVRLVGHFQPEFGCFLSLPVILDRKGIIRTIQLPLSSEEQAAVAESATMPGATIERINDQ